MCILHIHTCISCFNLKKLGIVLEIFLVQTYLTRDGSTPGHSSRLFWKARGIELKIDMPRVVA